MRERFYNAITRRLRSARDFARSATGTSQFKRAMRSLAVAVRNGDLAGAIGSRSEVYGGARRLVSLSERVVRKFLEDNPAWQSYVNAVVGFAKSQMRQGMREAGVFHPIRGVTRGLSRAARGGLNYAMATATNRYRAGTDASGQRLYKSVSDDLIDAAWRFVEDAAGTSRRTSRTNRGSTVRRREGGR